MKELLEKRDTGTTLLGYAAFYGKAENVAMLVEMGADINAKKLKRDGGWNFKFKVVNYILLTH
jgi:hypothetical protein